jgi:hypothetical protein
MKKGMVFLSVAVAVTLFQGCSAHVSGGGDQGGTDPTQTFKNLVDGPSLDGTWKSVCRESDRNYGEYEVITITVSGQNVSRQSAVYVDSACAQPDTTGTVTESGLFRYSTSNSDGVYGLEYQFNLTGLPPGMTGTYSSYENVRLDGEILYVSDEIGGTAVPEIALINTLAPAPAPAPVPTPTSVPTTSPVSASGGHVPKLGDTVTYTGLSGGAAETEIYTNQGYDSENGEWAIFENIQGPNPDMGYSDSASIWSSAQTASKLQNCVSTGGVLQTITVKAGTFQTCMSDDGKSKRWYGDIPVLGLVKMVSDDGTYSVEVSSYQWADSQAPRL